jgi:pimeloyl-ACP methyl ester carboxylesterase
MERQPRILMLHGLMSGHVVWNRLRQEMAGEARFVAPNLLGYGPAERPNGSYELDVLLDHLAPLVERFQPTHLLGHSMGGIVALGLRAKYPGRFRSVGIIGLPVYRDRIEALEYLGRRGLIVSTFLRNHHVSHAACFVARYTHPAWRPYARRRFPLQPEENFRALFAHTSRSHGGALEGLIFPGAVHDLALPGEGGVTLLHGTADRAAPFDSARELAEAADWCFRAETGANHQVVVEQPALVADWVRRDVLHTGLATRPSS